MNLSQKTAGYIRQKTITSLDHLLSAAPSITSQQQDHSLASNNSTPLQTNIKMRFFTVVLAMAATAFAAPRVVEERQNQGCFGAGRKCSRITSFWSSF